MYESFRKGSIQSLNTAYTFNNQFENLDYQTNLGRPWVLTSASPNNDQFLVVYQQHNRLLGYSKPVINLIMRERVDEDSIAEEWIEINLEAIEGYASYFKGKEILEAIMLDRNSSCSENSVKDKYLMFLIEGGKFLSIKLQTPLQSDTYMKALSFLEDDMIFEIIISIIFVGAGLVSCLMNRRTAQRQQR